jgi:hypothetical protein
MVFKMEINYNTLIEKIKETRNNSYDCTILMFFAGEVIMEEEDIELSNDFFPLLLYFDTVACDDKVRFQELINFLYNVCNKREIDSFDVNYILNKEEIITLIDKYKLGFIPKDLLFYRLKKYFFSDDVTSLLKLFEKRENIIIVL